MNRLSERLSATLTLGLLLATLLWTVGQVFRDLTLATAWCFYVPSPLLLATLLVASLLVRRRRWLAVLLAALAVGPLWSVLAVENRWTVGPQQQAEGLALRVVHWNVMWGKRGWPAIAAELASLDADAYVLSEAPAGFDTSAFAGYEVRRAHAMAFLARGRVGELVPRFNKAEVRNAWVDWHPPGLPADSAPVRLLLADVSSMPHLDRGSTIRLLRVDLALFKPDLLIGDLNTPRLARGLTPPPPGYRHAYDAAGSGLSYTWPVPLPMLSIDHTLCGPRVMATGYELQTSWLSGHRRQVIELVLPTGGKQR